MLSVKQVSIKYHFWVFGMTRPGIEPQVSRAIGEYTCLWVCVCVCVCAERAIEKNVKN